MLRTCSKTIKVTAKLSALKTFQCKSGIKMLQPYTSTLALSCNHASAASSGKTQGGLPRLPVPKLSDTLSKFLITTKPHLDDVGFMKTSKAVIEFALGVGHELQTLLEKRAKERENWLEEWWLSTAYLGYRDSVVVNSSPGLVFPFRNFRNHIEQISYAAKTLAAVLEYKALIDNNKIPVEKMGKNPLDMSQYKKIFGTCRIPRDKEDELSYNDSKYITVIHNNNICHVDLWGEDGEMLNECQIAAQLQHVVYMTATPADAPVGVFTSENRDTWAKVYQLLEKNEQNKKSLEDVARSIAVLCLDSPVGLWDMCEKDVRQSLAAAQTIHGGGACCNGANRWFDKTVQFIVGADGLTGLTYEHSPAEGQPIAVLTDYIIDFIDKCKVSEGHGSVSPIPPTKVSFTLDSDLRQMMQQAYLNLNKMAEDLDISCFTYDAYGKDFIKSQKLSPDSYIQMALQYAFYSLHCEPGAHYESAATRMFAGGRTETIRSCSPQSVEFARAMLGGAPPAAAAALLRAAVQAHKDYTVQALQGQGVDRHLLGLKLIALENGMDVPALYSDPGYVKSSRMRISSSQVACRCDGFMCYGPLVADGYAACYNPRPGDINFGLSASRAGTGEGKGAGAACWRQAITRALDHMRDTLRKAPPLSKL